jgi:hypothetical protein
MIESRGRDHVRSVGSIGAMSAQSGRGLDHMARGQHGSARSTRDPSGRTWESVMQTWGGARSPGPGDHPR